MSDGTIPFRGPGALRRRCERFATVGAGVKPAGIIANFELSSGTSTRRIDTVPHLVIVHDERDEPSVLVLDDRGDPVGTCVLPPRATVRQGRRTHVRMTRRDDVDLVAVLRYRPEPALRASSSSAP